jgi:hypothetical protein
MAKNTLYKILESEMEVPHRDRCEITEGYTRNQDPFEPRTIRETPDRALAENEFLDYKSVIGYDLGFRGFSFREYFLIEETWDEKAGEYVWNGDILDISPIPDEQKEKLDL